METTTKARLRHLATILDELVGDECMIAEIGDISRMALERVNEERGDLVDPDCEVDRADVWNYVISVLRKFREEVPREALHLASTDQSLEG